MDRELLLEESLGKARVMNDTLIKENKELQKQLKSYDERLERLQENNVRKHPKQAISLVLNIL